MRIYLQKNSAFSILLILALGSCSAPLYKDMEPATLTGDAGPSAWFRADTGRTLFRADISIRGSELSGLLFIKPLKESRRVLFITETGIKILDMDFTAEGGFGAIYIAGYMNRKPLIKAFGKALSPMLFNTGPEAVEAYIDKSSGTTIIKSADRNGKKTCSLNPSTGKVEELVQDKVFSPRVMIWFYSAAPERPDSIRISVPGRRLNIQLTAINEN